MKIIQQALSLVAMLFFVVQAHGQHLLKKPYQPSISEGKIKAWFKDIRKKTGVEISYSASVLDVQKKVKPTANIQTVEQALTALLAGLQVKWIERPDKILIVASGGEEVIAKPEEKITLSGFIRDSLSKEVLIGATVYLPSIGAGTFTNSYGFYSLTVPAAQYDMTVSYIGYSKKAMRTGGGRQDIALMIDDAMEEEVSIVQKKEKPLDKISLTADGINKYAALLGDNDVMRSLQHYPGVQQGADGSIGLIVRGGDPSQNLCMLDGVPLYYIDHIVGISSIYNTEALKATDFYTGSFPARYGGRLSSIIDVHTKDGDMEEFGGSAKLGFLSGSATLEGPIVKNKASMIVSARRSWVDLLWRPFDNALGLDFYDINGKINYQINSSNRLYLSIYNGRDQLRVTDNSDADNTLHIRGRWGNSFAALKWTTVLSSKIFVNTTATYSGFRYELVQPDFSNPFDTSGIYQTFTGKSRIRDRNIRSQLFWYISNDHKVEIGLQYGNAIFDPAISQYPDGSPRLINGGAAPRFTSNEIVAYAEDEFKLGKRIKVRAGLHFAYWTNKDFSYPTLQPRLHITYKASDALTIYGSATRMAQFLHLLSNVSFGFPTDFWLPSTGKLVPEISTLGNLGFRLQPGSSLNFGMELYYKDQQNLTSYRGSNDVFDHTQNWEGRLTQGSGRSYGVECSVDKQFGNISLAVAYTLSKSERTFAELNHGETFPYRYDRRHNLHIDGVYKISKNISYTASWTFMNGEAITLPDQIYPDFDNNLLNHPRNFSYTYNYALWNSYRLPAIHRLDMAVNFTRKKGRRYERTLTIGIFNAYGRKNIVGTLLFTDGDTGALKLETYSVGRFLPTISYRIQF